MLQFDWQEELLAALSRSGNIFEQTLELAFLRLHPLLLVNTPDSRLVEWKNLAISLHFKMLASPPAPAPVEFCSLIIYVTLWQSALRGAKHFCISNFFDLFVAGTVKWLEAAIERGVVYIPIFFMGSFTCQFEIEINSQGLLALFNAGLKAVEEITRLSPGMDLSSGHPSFGTARRFPFSIWPDDPFEAIDK